MQVNLACTFSCRSSASIGLHLFLDGVARNCKGEGCPKQRGGMTTESAERLPEKQLPPACMAPSSTQPASPGATIESLVLPQMIPPASTQANHQQACPPGGLQDFPSPVSATSAVQEPPKPGQNAERVSPRMSMSAPEPPKTLTPIPMSRGRDGDGTPSLKDPAGSLKSTNPCKNLQKLSGMTGEVTLNGKNHRPRAYHIDQIAG
jgi:hypothetical protein